MMNNDGKLNLALKKTFLKKNNSITERNSSPYYINNTFYNNFMNNKSLSNFYRNSKGKRRIHFPTLDYSNNYLSSTEYYNSTLNPEKKIDDKYSPNNAQQNEGALLIQRMKNYQRKKNETNILNDFYIQHYKEMTKKKRIDESTNGINLSISNYETQSPINNTVEEHEDTLIQKLKYIVENYEKRKANSSKKSYDSYKKERYNNKTAKSILVNKLNRSPSKKNQIDAYENTNDCKLNEVINRRRRNLSKNYYKTLNYFRRNDENIFIEDNNSLNEVLNNKVRNIKKIKDFRYVNRSKIKLMNIYNKKNGKKNLSENKLKNIDLINYEEQLFEKIKIFIKKVEHSFIKTLKNNYLFFIEQLKLFVSQKNQKDIDYISLMNRFQKSRNVKNTFINSESTFSINNYNNSVENLENKSKIYKKFSKINSIRNTNKYIQKNSSFKTINYNNTIYNKKRKNIKIFPYFSSNKNAGLNENPKIVRNLNTQKIFTSSKKDILKKDNNEYNNFNCNSTNKKTKVKTSHFKYIFSYDRSSNNSNNNNESSTYRNNDNNSKKTPIIYTKPQTKTNYKKIFISKDIENLYSNNSYNSKSILCDKALSNRSLHFYRELNNCYNTISECTLLCQKNNKNKNPIKSYAQNKNDNTKNNNKLIQNNSNNKNKKGNGKPLSKNFIEKHITKKICSSDKRLWINVKYISSGNSMQMFYKMKIKRIALNPNNGITNIFLNNKFKILKCAKTDSIEIIPTSLFKRHTRKNNKKINFDIILEENNEDNNNITIKFIDIFQNFEKKYISFYKKYFFDLLKMYLNSLSQRKIFDDIKNNFKTIDNKSIFNMSNENIHYNDVGIDSINNSDTKTNKRRKKNLMLKHWKSFLFLDNNNLKLNEEDKQPFYQIYSSKSEVYERGFSKNMNGGDKVKYKYNKLNNKSNKKPLIKVNLAKKINFSEKKRKKNKIMKSLINKFSHYNNCLRIKKKYFINWRIKNDEYKELANMSNGNINNITGKDTNNDSIENVKGDEEKKVKGVGNNRISKNNVNINQKYKLIKMHKKINEPLNQKRNNTINDGSKSIYPDNNELEEKIEYLRRYLINYYVFKDNNVTVGEED